MKEISVIFEELQDTHSQYTIPSYFNRFSKLYERHFETLCAGLEMNRANRAEGLLGLGSGARTEPSTEQLEMQLTNA